MEQLIEGEQAKGAQVAAFSDATPSYRKNRHAEGIAQA